MLVRDKENLYVIVRKVDGPSIDELLIVDAIYMVDGKQLSEAAKRELTQMYKLQTFQKWTADNMLELYAQFSN
jgi:hypothetical protein